MGGRERKGKNKETVQNNDTVSNFMTYKTRKNYEFYESDKEAGTDSHFTCLK